ncbi:protein phosphatase [Longispora sp. NPDC051575]|uniref:protein phosphatase n=1 Tax=Longispora sp. NPDC051575 TaxID=3154943 RepID=UPI00343C9F47
MSWEITAPGVLRLPSGRLVRGRGLRHPLPAGPLPTFGVYLLGKPPPAFPWESAWIRWPDFRLPSDRVRAREVLAEAWRRAGTDPDSTALAGAGVGGTDLAGAERVEVACGGGRGRTGTALACLAILDGVPPGEAVAFVREHYHRHAVETPWQRRHVRDFT